MIGPYARAMPGPVTEPVGVVLAGGAGTRIGGAKAVADLAGKPLIGYPLAAMRAAGLRRLAVVAKPATELPALEGVEVWIEPVAPRHPLVGIVHALRAAGGARVLVCAADMPLISAATVAALGRADPGDAPAVIASSPARGIQPLLGLYLPAAAGLLDEAARAATAPVREAVAAIGPRVVEVQEEELFNVNSREDLELAAARLSRT